MSTVKKVKSSGNKAKAKQAKGKRDTSTSPLDSGAQAPRKASKTSKPSKKASAEKVRKVAIKTPPKKSARAGGKQAATSGKADAQKMMRDTFRMPRADFELLRALKARTKALGHPCKKSDLLRAGLHALQRYDDVQFKRAVTPEPSAAG